MIDRRYDSDYQTVQQVLAKKSLGEILEFEVHYDIDFPSWLAGMGDAKYSPGDGLCFGIGCHKLDQVLHVGRHTEDYCLHRTAIRQTP